MESVLNWLWQGSTVAIAAAVMLRFMEPSRARLRYRSLWVVLLTILLLPIVPLLWSVLLPVLLPAPVAATAPPEPVVTIPAGWWTSTSMVIAVWAAWSAVYAGRVARAAIGLRRAKQDCRPVPPDLETRLPCWCQVRTIGRRTRLVLSASVKSAAVLGGRSPVIAVAPGLLDHLTDRELDRVVIHEWAHVQRRDDSAHLLQLLVRVLAGWHPAVWWCDRQLNVEREIACDEMAVAVTGSTKEYAACLTRVASVPSVPVRPLAAVGLSTSSLRRRIVRILSFESVASRPARTGTAIVAGIVLAITAFSVGAVRAVGADRPFAGNGTRMPIDTTAASDAPLVQSMLLREVVELRVRPREQTRAASQGRPRNATASGVSAALPAVQAPSTPAGPATDSSGEQPVPPLASRSVVAPAAIDAVIGPNAAAASIEAAPLSGSVQPVSPWAAAADAGVAVGRSTQDAAVATAGLFKGLALKIAGSF